MKKEIKSLTNISDESQIVAGVVVEKGGAIETKYRKQLLRTYPKYWKITDKEAKEEKKTVKKTVKKNK